MKITGGILLFIGLLGTLIILFMNVGVDSSGSFSPNTIRVNNIGLMQQQSNYLTASSLLSLMGLILIIGGHISNILSDKLENIANIQAASEYYNRFPGAIICDKCNKEFRLTYQGKRNKSIACPHCLTVHNLTDLEKIAL